MIYKFFIGKKLLKRLNLGVLITAIIIVLFGCMNIYSVGGRYYMKLQLTWLMLGLITVYVILLFDYMFLQNIAGILYWFSIFLLLLNDFLLGSTTKGATSWIKFGNRAIQPSEFAKLALIIMLSKKLDDMEGNINEPKNFIILVIYALIPMILIVIQPDMGMTMVCFFTVLGIFFAAGLNLKIIIGGLNGILALVAIIWNSPLMKPYWKGRLVSFLNPEKYELDYGHQLIESQRGIGSGGVFGTGFLRGKQFKFVPEAHTDFIFSVLGEEWGLLGGIFLLILYGVLIYNMINTARKSKDIFGTMLCVGIISSLLFSVLQNIGMTIGIMPITGITLPFMSYGGSSMLTNFMSIGIVLNVGIRNKKLNF